MGQALAAGARFGSYTIVKLLGSGGMGAVYEARHEGLQKRVALKTLHAEVVHSQEAVERFVREGRTASMLRHPHVVDVTDVGVQDGIPYLVMELMEGRSLADLVEQDGALAPEAAVDISLPVIDALAVAHDAGVVHRDLKPDNIFLARSRTGGHIPKLLDFGISKVDSSQDGRLTKTSSMMGTPYYMSPEQARGAKNVEGKSDQFSFGLVLWELLAGRRAIEGESLLEIVHRVSVVDVKRLEQVRPDIPAALVHVVDRMIAADAGRRFPSMLAVGTALLPFASPAARATWTPVFEGHTAASTPPPAEPPAPRAVPTANSTLGNSARDLPLRDGTRTSWRGPVLAVAGVVVLAGAGYGAWVASRGPPPLPPTPHAAVPMATYTVEVRTDPPTAYLMMDGVSVGTGEFHRTLPRDGSHHALEARADGYDLVRVPFVDAAPPAVMTLVRTAPPVAVPPATDHTTDTLSVHEAHRHTRGHDGAAAVTTAPTPPGPAPEATPLPAPSPPTPPAHGNNGSPLIR